MQVTVISDTIQEFNGVRYYRCGFYFQRKGVRLHRVVWEAVHGVPVPAGFHVHHRDEDRSNNQPDNLELLEGRAHVAHHSKDFKPSAETTAKAVEAAKAWHASAAGSEWHRQHYRRIADKLHAKVDCTCKQCGRDFVGDKRSEFCGNPCKSAWRRASGLDDVQRSCAVCGGTFTANKYASTRTCSRKCGGTLIAQARGAHRAGGQV